MNCTDFAKHSKFHTMNGCPVCAMCDFCVVCDTQLDQRGLCIVCDARCAHDARFGDCNACSEELMVATT
jgi:hypothetical protein